MPMVLSIPAPCDASSAITHRAAALQSIIGSPNEVVATPASIPRRAGRVNPARNFDHLHAFRMRNVLTGRVVRASYIATSEATLVMKHCQKL